MKTRNQLTTTLPVVIFLLLVLILAGLTLSWIWSTAHDAATNDDKAVSTAFELAGQIGDRFGAVNALVSGAALLLIGWSLIQTNRSIQQMSDAIELQSGSLDQTKEAVAVQKQELEEHRKEFILNRVTNVIYRQVEMINQHGRSISYGPHKGLRSTHYVVEVSDGKPKSDEQLEQTKKKTMAFFNGKGVSEFLKKLDDSILLCTDLMSSNEIDETGAEQLWKIFRANLDDVDSTHTLASLTRQIMGSEAKEMKQKIDGNLSYEFAWKLYCDARDRAIRVDNWINVHKLGEPRTYPTD